jgi:AraC-like DNA-binding protein
VDKAVLNPVVFKHLLAELAAGGISPNVLCRGLGFDPSAFDCHTFRLSPRQAMRMLERALRTVPALALGHRVGKRRTLTSSGVFGLTFASAQSLSQALQLLVRYGQAMGTMLEIRVTSDNGESLYVDLAPPSEITIEGRALDFWACETMTSIVVLLRQVVNPRFAPSAIEWHMPMPSKHELLHSRFFAAPMQFSCPVTRMRISQNWAKASIPSADPVVHRQALAVMDSELCAPEEPAIRCNVVRLIKMRPDSPPRLTEVAAHLSMSERTLRRRLTALGSNYQDLVNEVRRGHAVWRLQQSNSTISDIASELGFTDVRNFRRTFKRWTGLAPASLRRRHDAQGE